MLKEFFFSLSEKGQEKNRDGPKGENQSLKVSFNYLFKNGIKVLLMAELENKLKRESRTIIYFQMGQKKKQKIITYVLWVRLRFKLKEEV